MPVPATPTPHEGTRALKITPLPLGELPRGLPKAHPPRALGAVAVLMTKPRHIAQAGRVLKQAQSSQFEIRAILMREPRQVVRSVETKIRSRTDALLRGLLYAPSGERMYPTYSRKNGRKYHYYVSKSESQFGAPGKSYERLPAPEIEAAVVAQIRTVLTSPESIASVVRHIQRNGAQIDEATTVMAMGRLNDVWDQLFPVERHRIANLMIERIDLVHVGEVQGIKVK